MMLAPRTSPCPKPASFTYPRVSQVTTHYRFAARSASKRVRPSVRPEPLSPSSCALKSVHFLDTFHQTMLKQTNQITLPLPSPSPSPSPFPFPFQNKLPFPIPGLHTSSFATTSAGPRTQQVVATILLRDTSTTSLVRAKYRFVRYPMEASRRHNSLHSHDPFFFGSSWKASWPFLVPSYPTCRDGPVGLTCRHHIERSTSWVWELTNVCAGSIHHGVHVPDWTHFMSTMYVRQSVAVSTIASTHCTMYICILVISLTPHYVPACMEAHVDTHSIMPLSARIQRYPKP